MDTDPTEGRTTKEDAIRALTTTALTILLLIVGCGGSDDGTSGLPVDPGPFDLAPETVVSISLRRGFGSDEKETTLTGRSQIDAILARMAYEPKEACRCAHDREMIFAKASGDTVRFSICSHCLDYVGTERGQMQHYKMPEALWKMVEKRGR